MGLGPISHALALAHRIRAVIHRNLCLAALYNVLVLGLALTGQMTPLRCALAMPLSSILILLATVRSLRDRPVMHSAQSSASSPCL